MNELVDFHCHLDLYQNFEEIVKECERKRVFTLAVTTTPRAWTRNFELSKQTKYVRAALGLHPQLITDDNPDFSVWETMFHQAKYIGEIGLDASPRYYKYFKNQQYLFDRILLKCSQSGGKVLSIHSVRCASKVIEHITANGTYKNNKIVLHWFTGTLSEAKKAIEIGCYFSVNTAMLQSEKTKLVVAQLPIESILTETDGPFTSKMNSSQHPWDVRDCVVGLATIFNITPDEMQNRIYQNLSKILT